MHQAALQAGLRHAGCCVSAQCFLQCRAVGLATLQFHAQHRHLRTCGANTDPRAARHAGDGVEHRLDLLGVQRPACGFHALRLAPAEPQAALCIEVPHVAHAVHDADAAIGQGFADLRCRGRLRAVEIAVGGGRPGHAGHHRWR
ncbi:hypothetical protein G6F24_016498 [Rhizopus arrhizus]|nr:hypothetical protein G6F24_016498 [Rhizopus arrhizus]